ncbi:hypothetical protein GOBAR_AA24354 [Gossypium barbadense]|uniref:RING-type domain-containing protein n=1 Tax=Gossypium barbadense TaxID=3634 RepID=A0A2P5WYY8_GOSBA|nr:hypothetical protein GOBAR_AA24354 [Gossypium barbadense]
MKVPCCSVCQTRYNEEERVPLLLQCGHGFCKECLSRMFSASSDTSLPCPRCRHVSLVGGRINRGSHASSSGGAAAGCGPVIELTAHPEVKLVRKIEGKGEGKGGRAGVETWAAVISGAYGGGGGRRCKHKVAVKKVGAMEGMDGEWVQGQLDSLRRASMWCRNVCTFHGVIKLEESSLGIVMDRCHGSIQSAMFNNEGRLTLEQVLRLNEP